MFYIDYLTLYNPVLSSLERKIWSANTIYLHFWTDSIRRHTGLSGQGYAEREGCHIHLAVRVSGLEALSMVPHICGKHCSRVFQGLWESEKLSQRGNPNLGWRLKSWRKHWHEFIIAGLEPVASQVVWERREQLPLPQAKGIIKLAKVFKLQRSRLVFHLGG